VSFVVLFSPIILCEEVSIFVNIDNLWPKKTIIQLFDQFLRHFSMAR